MKCHVDGCDRDAMYTKQAVCQKHYFRFMRNGTYGLLPKKHHYKDARGYERVIEPDHPLADSTGAVWLHRRIVYAKYGDSLPPCELCGKAITWATCHVDHIDENPSNNAESNLRPVCRGCNTSRTPRKTTQRFEYAGLKLSLLQWVKQPGVTGTRGTLLRRMRAGMTFEEALFARNPTHPKYTSDELAVIRGRYSELEQARSALGSERHGLE